MSDDWRSYRQGRKGWSPTSGTNLTEWRRGRNHKLLGEAFDFNKHGKPGEAGASAGAGAVILILIFGAIVLVGNLGGHSNKSAREQSASQPQTPANLNTGSPDSYYPLPGSIPPASGTYAPLVKPPAGHPFGAPAVDTAKSGTPAAGVAAPGPESEPEPDSRSRPSGPYRFVAIHREFGGGCAGELVLSNEGLHFSCLGQPDIDVPLAEIERLDNDGVRLLSGKKYHFKISDDHKAEVESIFASWLDKARQNRAANGYSGSNTPAN